MVLLLWSVQPRRAEALDLASSTIATGGGVVAIIGAVMMGKEDTERTGRTMLIAGLAVSGVFSAASVLLNVLVLSTMDRLTQLEQEADAGSGPLIDALSTSFGVPRDEVIRSVRRTQARQTLRSAEDAQLFAELLIADLGTRAAISDILATHILHDLHTERSKLGGGGITPRHAVIAEIIGISTEEVAPTIARHLDQALNARIEPGKVFSARTLLASESSQTLNALLDDLAREHQHALLAKADAARASSRAFALMAAER
jgi:hypothetical protein